MAPQPTSPQAQVELELESVIASLYTLLIQAYDYRGAPIASSISASQSQQQHPMVHGVQDLVRHLQAFSRASKAFDVTIPPDVIAYVEGGRNPDIYTREFVENVQLLNQTLKGRSEAFGQLSEILGEEIRREMPEVEGEVEAVRKATAEVGSEGGGGSGNGSGGINRFAG